MLLKQTAFRAWSEFTYTQMGNIGYSNANQSLTSVWNTLSFAYGDWSHQIVGSGPPDLSDIDAWTVELYGLSGAPFNVYLENFVAVPEQVPPQPTSYTWSTNDSGDWNSNSVRTPYGIGFFSPNSPDDTVVFGSAIQSTQTMFTNTAVTVNRIEFDDSTHSYFISGGGSVNLVSTTTQTPVTPTISVIGMHEFQVEVNLHNHMLVDITDLSP